MSENSDWTDLFDSISDPDDLLSSLLEEQTENPKDVAEKNKPLHSPLQVTDPRISVANTGSPSSEFPTQGFTVQDLMDNEMPYAMNALGFPYQQQWLMLIAGGSGAGGAGGLQMLQGFPQQVDVMNDLAKGRKRIIETPEEAERREKMKKIKNRLSAARSRARRLERTKFLEEKVEELRAENEYMKKILEFDDMIQKDTEMKKLQEMEEKEVQTEKFRGLRRTLSAPCMVKLTEKGWLFKVRAWD